MQYLDVDDDQYLLEQNRQMRLYEFFRGGREENDWKLKRTKLLDPEGFERKYYNFKLYHRKKIEQLEQCFKDVKIGRAHV